MINSFRRRPKSRKTTDIKHLLYSLNRMTIILSPILLCSLLCPTSRGSVLAFQGTTRTEGSTNMMRNRFLSAVGRTALRVSNSSSSSSSDTAVTSSTSPYLTPELEKMTKAFASLSDEKTRYKQLLFMANQLPPLPESSKIPENKVPGCLSTVHVDCTTETNIDGEQGDGDVPIRIYFRGDSDGQLTKGLVALLVRGLSGHTAEEIDQVDPSFIHAAKISQSLTPGRNNGFLNMLATMKRKAKQATASYGTTTSTSTAPTTSTAVNADENGRPIYTAILSTLTNILKPMKITLVDNSDQHSGHAGSKGFEGGESHFAVSVVAEAFEGLPLVKRHQLIYMLLGDIMPKIHALQIEAKAPSEVSS